MQGEFNRRQFLKTLLYAGGASTLPLFQSPAWAQTGYNGKLLVAVQLDGGIDVSSFCDPKENQPGEQEINHWARDNDIRQAGNIPYAPFAGNSNFFENHFQKTLVINGVDAQTNAHSVGIMHNWSGRNSDGYPSITALMAAVKAPELPLSYLNFGGFAATQGMIGSTRIGNPSQLKSLIFANSIENTSVPTRILSGDWARIQQLQRDTLMNKIAMSGLPAGNRLHRQSYLDAIDRAEGLQTFGAMIPDAKAIQPVRSLYNRNSNLHQQVQVTLLAFKAGVSIAADIVEHGYDTHDDHDARHESLLANTTDALEYLWSYAEELELANRLVVVIGSDFSRTPRYNSGGGKDHWPIGSYVVMEKNAVYTNQVIGETDDGQNTFALSPATLQRDSQNGLIVRPAHVHKALRNYLGLNSHPLAARFQFDAIEDFAFFD